MTFQFAITNTSPVLMPGDIDISASFDDNCLTFVSAEPTPTSTTSNYISWSEQKMGLAVGEVYTTTIVVKAKAACEGTMRNGIYLSYFLTGTSQKASYTILNH